MIGKGSEVDGCDDIDQQTHVEDTEHGSQHEAEDTNNKHFVNFWTWVRPCLV